MGAWMALDRRLKVFAVAAAAVVVASVAYAVLLRTVFLGAHATTTIDDIGEALAAGLASAACAWAATRAVGRDRLGWALMSASAGLWAAGEVVWSIYEVGLGQQVPSPSLADAGFLSAVPFAIAGIRAFWSDKSRGTSSRWRVWFDAVIVAIALTSTAWAFGLRTVVTSNQDVMTKALNLAYPVGDILIGTVLILAIRRATRQQAGRMALLLAGVACYSIADSAFAYLTAAGAYGQVGSALNTGWFAGFLLIALAAMYPAAPARVVTKQPLDLWQLALPWMTLLLASAGDVYSALFGHDLDLVMSSMTAILALLLTVNMVVERREFLEMLTEIQESHTTLNREFRTALVEVRRLSQLIRDAERFDSDEARRIAGDIHRVTDRLDDMVEDILDTEVEGANLELAAEVPISTGAVVAAGRRA